MIGGKEKVHNCVSQLYFIYPTNSNGYKHYELNIKEASMFLWNYVINHKH